jgi:Flp pilus assembly protein TadG
MASIFARTIAFSRRVAVRGGLARFGRDQKGATVVEFALVATPFFALMFAIIETALLFFADQALDTAVSTESRLIRTGQAQADSLSAADFKAKICDRMVGLADCASSLKVDVRKYADFNSINLNTPLDANGNLKVTENYQTGHGGDIVVVRAYYEWPTFVPGLGNNLANMPDGNRLLVATAAFRNEPFSW